MKGAWDATRAEIQNVERSIQTITTDQTRLRQNLREMPREAEAYKTYLKKFDDQEKEMDVLANVWAYAGAKEERKFLRESIIDSLTKAVEEPGGSVVCVMGRIAQTIGSLAGLDAAVKIAPQYAILREVSARAGVIHAELLGAMSENDRRVVQEDEGEIANALANGLKSDLRARLKEEYVASGLLKEKVFARETAWIDTLY